MNQIVFFYEELKSKKLELSNCVKINCSYFSLSSVINTLILKLSDLSIIIYSLITKTFILNILISKAMSDV